MVSQALIEDVVNAVSTPDEIDIIIDQIKDTAFRTGKIRARDNNHNPYGHPDMRPDGHLNNPYSKAH